MKKFPEFDPITPPMCIRNAIMMIKLQGWMMLISGVGWGLFYVFLSIFGLLTGTKEDLEPGILILILGLVLVLGSFGLGILCFKVAKAILYKRPWGRFAGLIMGVLFLLFPMLGIFIGILILIGLLKKEGQDWFKIEPPTPA